MDKRIGLSIFFFFLLFLVIARIQITLAFPGNTSANRTSLASGSEYGPTTNYGFEILWNETNETGASCCLNVTDIANVTFETNINGTTLNFTTRMGHNTTPTPTGLGNVSNNTDGIYWINFTMESNITSAGNYTFRWFAANKTNNISVTDTVAYNIDKNNSIRVAMNITAYAIGGAESNTTDSSVISYQGQGSPYADCWMGGLPDGTGQTKWGTTSLYRNETAWTKGSSGATSLSVAKYTVKCNSTGNTNYTSNSTGGSYTLTVSASGGGGGGGGGVTTQPTATTTPIWDWQPPTEGWEIDPKVVIVILIIIAVIASGKKKR